MTKPDDTDERIEGLEPRQLFRAALGEPEADPQDAERVAEEERGLRAEIERRLPDLELFELLGRGGMGSVFRAHQKKLDREVALKVVAPEARLQTDFSERFEREARAMARLNHPNIVAVHDYGRNGPLCWLVMEYVQGSNLRDVIRAGELAPTEALALIPKICDALQFAHDHGVVHRDVKPENILLDGEGGVKIADFGLAKLIGRPAALVSLTGSQQLLGTLRYMSPEQLDRPLEVDHRADIYSLGVVIYEMLTGEIPMGRFDPPSQRCTASVEVDGVVLRALEKEPERRYQSAAEVKADLDSLERGERPAPATEAARTSGAALTAQGTPGPKLSKRAVVSAVLFGLWFAPCMVLVALWLAVRPYSIDELLPTGDSSTLSIASLVILLARVIPGGAWLTLTFLGTTQGFRALTEIRAAWPRRDGVGAAVVGAWGPIVVAANALFLTVILALVASPGDDSAYAPVTEVVVLLLGDVALLVWLRRGFLDRCRALEAKPRDRRG